MAEIVEFEVASGGVLRVQAVDGLDGGGGQGLVPAAPSPGEVIQKAKETLEAAVGSVTPALGVITRQLRAVSPDEVEVEFGLVLTAEHGVIIAKASGEVHFNVRLTWQGSQGSEGSALSGEQDEKGE
jgi:hypothetical protein